MVHSEKNNFWSFLTFRWGGPDQGSENSELFFFRMNPSLSPFDMFYEKIVPYCISITRESRVTTQSTQTSHLCTAVPASVQRYRPLYI